MDPMRHRRPEPSDTTELRERVRELVASLGQLEAASRLGVHPTTALAIAAGGRVMRGTLALVREHLRNGAGIQAADSRAAG
jgi:hypothetical protein